MRISLVLGVIYIVKGTSVSLDRPTSSAAISSDTEVRRARACDSDSSAIMNFVLFAIAFSARVNDIVGNGMRVNINRYCRDKDRLITSEENDEYLLVDAKSDTTIALACRYW